MSSPLLPLLATLLLTVLPSPTLSATAKPIKALVTPITKQTSTSLFTVSLHAQPNRSFLIDLSTPLSWLRCHNPTPSPPLLCRSPLCSTAQSSSAAACPFRPHRNNKPSCICSAALLNPLQSNRSCSPSTLTFTNLSLPSTDGHKPLATVAISRVVMGCAPKPFLPSLPRGAAGLASLSRAPLSIPSQLATSRYKLTKQFALCLPSSDTAPGVAFFGSEPFFLLPPPGRNVSGLLQFTPLIQPPVKNRFGYYIGVKGISINGKAVNFPTKLLGFDAHGRGGVQLSTVVPYTALRSSIYRAFISQYERATSGIPRVKKVAPFELCLNTSRMGSTRVGLPVAQVDLQLKSGGNWTMFGANTFKQVADDVACLAFVDGGERAEQAVVIGSFQIEHNFLLFDLVKSRLGFSSLLFFFQTTCGNFNFTSGV